MKLTSIIIPACNEEEYIGRTINSLKNQRFKRNKRPYELIVVANGCEPSDDTANIANALGARVIEIEEANVSNARNIGVGQAQGEYLIFNDADTIVASNYVEKIACTLDNKYDYGSALFKPENCHPISILYFIMAWGSSFILRNPGGNMFVSRDIFEKVNGFNESLSIGEDTDLGRRIKNAGGRYKFLHGTAVITSMRKFKQNGYLNELFRNQVFLYVKQLFPKLRK